MSKAKIFQTGKGATLIYQKDASIKGYKIVIAFRGGAQFDGAYPGLSHLIEHLFFRELREDKTQKFLEKTLEKCMNLGAHTSSQIALYFGASKEEIEKMVSAFMNRLMSTNFTQEQILKEIDVISHEIELSSDDDPGDIPVSSDFIINSLQANRKESGDILGVYRKLKKHITPEIVQDYIKRYFTEANLMVSVVTNETYDEAVKLFEKNILPKVYKTKSKDVIAEYPKQIYFHPSNVCALEPDEYTSGCRIDFYLRERLFESSNTEFELACDCIESNIMGEIGGVMWNEFRLHNQLSYLISLSNVDLGTSKFKIFTVNTSGAKLNTAIRKICQVIKNTAENGVDRKLFEGVQKALIDAKNNSLYQTPKPDALDNFESYLNGYHIVDNDRVNYYIQHMTYEQFNEQIKKVYSYAQPSLHVTGEFDSRKCYNLIEIEEMLGNRTHSKEKNVLNVPRYEVTRVPMTDEEQAKWDTIAEENGIDANSDDLDLDGGL